jgi:hypothetical protein
MTIFLLLIHTAAILQQYELASGQKMNNNKTAIFFNRNTLDANKEIIQRSVGMPAIQWYDTYVGLLALVGRSWMVVFKA